MLLDLCRAQQAAGLDVRIAHFDHPYFVRHCQEMGIRSFALPDRAKFKRSLSLPAFARGFAARMRRERIDLLHSHLFGPIVGGALASRFAGIPHLGTLHDIHMVEESPRRIYQLQAALLMGTKLVAVSKQMLAFYRSRLRWKKNAISCIYNGVEPNAQAEASPERDLPDSLDGIVVIVVGRLVPLKRVADALRAARIALETTPITLMIVGDGPERARLEALARELQIEHRVRFLGERKDVPYLLAHADVFVQCSETEGLSMSIIEAMHAALPCIVTNVGGNPELIEDRYNGALISTGDVPALAQWIGTLARDASTRKLMGERSHEIATQRFSGQACAAAYLRLYQDLGFKAPTHLAQRS